MKVLFIYYDTGSSEPPRIGLGVAYLSAFLKRHGHKTKLCYFRSSEDIHYALSIIEEWKPQIVAHSSTSSSFFSVREVTNNIKTKFPNLFQICGGNHVSLCPDELLNLPELDAICISYGDADRWCTRWLRNQKKRKGGNYVQKNSSVNFFYLCNLGFHF